MRRGYKIAKNGRAFVPGRFISDGERAALDFAAEVRAAERAERVERYAKLGELTRETVGGVTFYRGPDGRRVSAKIAAKQRGGVPEVVGRSKRSGGRGRKVLHPERLQPELLTKAKAPKETGFRDQLHFNSAPKLVGDLSAAGDTTTAQWMGKIYAIPADRAGYFQDALRGIQSRYIALLKPFTESPQLQIEIAETSAGFLFDLDKLEPFDDELITEMGANPEFSEALKDFYEYTLQTLSTTFTHAPQKDKAKPANRKRSGKR